MLTRLAEKIPVRSKFCFVIFIPDMLITSRHRSPSPWVTLTQVIGAKSAVPSSTCPYTLSSDCDLSFSAILKNVIRPVADLFQLCSVQKQRILFRQGIDFSVA